jgi:hypothetical protein
MTICKTIKYCSIIVLNLFLLCKISGQQPDITVSGSYNNSPFLSFVEDVERSTPLRFYYSSDWIKEINITASGNNMNLRQILNDHLKKAGLEFLIEGYCIYIYQGDPIITRLPSYSVSTVRSDKPDSSTRISETEKKYREGRMIASANVLEVGNKMQHTDNSKCVIDGKIIDQANSDPLIGATVYIKELKTGTVTDVDGKFKLLLNPGKYAAVFNYVSMKQQEYILQVYSSGSLTVEMKKELIELGEVKISANRYNHVKGMQMGFERISSKTMKEIPVVLGEKDVLKVAQMLPGVLNVGEGSSGFNVRGSSADQNMFYINKVPIYNTSHLFGFFTSFNPDVINDFTLYKSNIPASYGGRLSSIFNITSRQGSKKKFYSQGGISPITARFSLEVPAIKDKLSIVTSFRSSYSDWILKKIKDRDIKNSSAFFYDGTLSANAEINDRNLIKAFGYISNDRFSLSSLNDYNYSNSGASLAWKHVFSSSFSADLAAIYSNYAFENTNKVNLSTAFTQNYQIDHYETRIDFSMLTNLDHKLEFGANGIYYSLNRGNIEPYGEESNRAPLKLGLESGLEYALYLSDEFTLFDNLTTLAGIRYSFFNQYGPAAINIYQPGNRRTIYNIGEVKEFQKGELIKTYSGPEYRLALNYILGPNSSLKTSYNRLYQYIFMLSNTIAISPDDKWKMCDYHIAPPVADQVSLGYYRDFRDGGIKVSLELYHKWIKNQVEYKDGADFASSDPLEVMILQGKQRVDGVEMMINKNIGKITGWVSYCYSRSLIQVDDVDPENQINKGVEYPSNYDRPHSVNMVMNYRINRRLSLSSNFVYATGRPITYPVSLYYSEGQEMLLFSERNKFRIPDYARLDLSINLEGNLNRKKPIHSYWMINLYNVFSRSNAYSVYYESDHGRIRGHKLSIFGVPLLTLSWNYKFGNYLND